jgi:hypothetical protein
MHQLGSPISRLRVLSRPPPFVRETDFVVYTKALNRLCCLVPDTKPDASPIYYVVPPTFTVYGHR